MELNLDSDGGFFKLRQLSFSWGNSLEDLDLPGFTCLSWGVYSLEMGEVDQGSPGLYVTKIENSTPILVATLLQF